MKQDIVTPVPPKGDPWRDNELVRRARIREDAARPISVNLPQIPRYEELAPKETDADLEGIQVKVCSLEDLRAMKRAANRLLDRLDLEALEIAHPEDRNGG